MSVRLRVLLLAHCHTTVYAPILLVSFAGSPTGSSSLLQANFKRLLVAAAPQNTLQLSNLVECTSESLPASNLIVRNLFRLGSMHTTSTRKNQVKVYEGRSFALYHQSERDELIIRIERIHNSCRIEITSWLQLYRVYGYPSDQLHRRVVWFALSTYEFGFQMELFKRDRSSSKYRLCGYPTEFVRSTEIVYWSKNPNAYSEYYVHNWT